MEGGKTEVSEGAARGGGYIQMGKLDGKVREPIVQMGRRRSPNSQRKAGGGVHLNGSKKRWC